MPSARQYPPRVDAEDFKLLYELMSRQIFGFAAQRVGAQGAADVVAETFKTAWEKRSQGPADEDERRAWVFGIAKLKIRQEQDRVSRKHHDHRFIEDFAGEMAATSDIADDVVEAVVGRWIYAELSEAERELLDLAFMPGLTSDQVAGLLSISVGTLHTRISRLRARIRQLAGQAEPDIVEGGAR